MPSGDAHLNPPDTSISARVREDLSAGEAPVDLTGAERVALRILTRPAWRLHREVCVCADESLTHEAHYLARAVLRQSALLDEYEARLAERERT